jgi:hypothetical protein
MFSRSVANPDTSMNDIRLHYHDQFYYYSLFIDTTIKTEIMPKFYLPH